MSTQPPQANDIAIDGDVFRVLVNDEDQHSIWPAGIAIPDGWSSVGPAGDKATCLAYVEANWTDMRPRSLREAMQRDAGMRNAAQS
jgi:MbtH protein